ncbi:MAG: ABC transporter permease [Clostridiales bacterium]|nr:ABC transporter permease [Clostridiales bacterium]
MQDEEYCLQNCPKWLYEYLFGVNNIDNFESYMNNYCYRNYDHDPSFDEYISSNVHGINPEDMDVSSKIDYLYSYMVSNPDDKTYTSKSYNELHSEFEQKYGGHDYDTYCAAVIKQAFSDGSIVDHGGLYVTSYQMTLSNNFTRLYETIENATFAGVFMPEDRDQFSKERGVVLSDANFAKMDTSKAGNYNFVIAKMPEGGALENIIRFTYDNEENNMVFSIRNGVMSTLSMVNGLIESLSEIFLYVGIGFAVFSALMLTNFISTSISYKKKEIGILRAIGAKSSDVYSIFFNESLLIALINFTLATAATVGVVLFLNSFLRKEYNLVITLLNFGIRQVALMFAVSVAVAVIASFFPVYRVAKKRPVEAIRK